MRTKLVCPFFPPQGDSVLAKDAHPPVLFVTLSGLLRYIKSGKSLHNRCFYCLDVEYGQLTDPMRPDNLIRIYFGHDSDFDWAEWHRLVLLDAIDQAESDTPSRVLWVGHDTPEYHSSVDEMLIAHGVTPLQYTRDFHLVPDRIAPPSPEKLTIFIS